MPAKTPASDFAMAVNCYGEPGIAELQPHRGVEADFRLSPQLRESERLWGSVTGLTPVTKVRAGRSNCHESNGQDGYGQKGGEVQ
jgi:hypothetical protein